MTAAGATTDSNSPCPRCGALFRCGMVAADDQCWCVKRPHIMPVPSILPSTRVDSSKNHGGQHTIVHPEPVEGPFDKLRTGSLKAQAERSGGMNFENINSEAGASCFCPACLQHITDARQHNKSPARD